MPDQKFILRDFIPEDCVHLPALLKAVWKTQTDEDYWLWKYVRPPFETQGWVAEKENGNIAAFSGYWRRPAKTGDTNTIPVMVVDVMADPEYRGGKVYGEISKQILEIIGGETIFGFTNPVSHKLFKRMLKDYIKIDANIPVFISLLDGGCVVRSNRFIKSILGSVTRFVHMARLKIPGKKNILVQNAYHIGDEFDQLWEDVGDEYAFILNRGKDYLRWRYTSSPTRKYQIWKAVEKGRLVGYLVTATKYESNRTKAFLMDWLVSHTRNDVFEAMIKTALSWLLSHKIDLVETWLLAHEKDWIQILRSHFFLRSKRTYSFLLAAGDRVIQTKPLGIEDLFLTIGDSDYLATATI